MNVALAGIVIGLITLALVVVGHAIVVARWSARLQTLVEIHSAQLGKLERSKDDHAHRLAVIEGKVDEHVRNDT